MATITLEEVLAAPRDLDLRRRWAEAGDSPEQRLARMQFERAGAPERWSLAAATAEGELAWSLPQTFPGISTALVTGLRFGLPGRVKLSYQHGLSLDASCFEGAAWATVDELHILGFCEPAAFRQPVFLRLRALQCLEHTLVTMVRELEAAGLLAQLSLTELSLTGEDVSPEAWEAIRKLPMLRSLHVRALGSPPPPGALARLEEIGGIFLRLPELWVSERSILRACWERHGLRIVGHREPGEKLSRLDLTPLGMGPSPFYSGKLEDRVASGTVGGHDDDRRKIHFHVLDSMPAHVRSVRLVQDLAFFEGPRLLDAPARKKLGVLLEMANERREIKATLDMPALPPKKPRKG